MPELDIGLADDELNFDKSFLQINGKKKIYMLRLLLDLTLNAEY